MQKAIFASLIGISLCIAHSADAALVHYELSFDGSVAGPAGFGSFDWNQEELMMTNLLWSFDSGASYGYVSNEELAFSTGQGSLGLFTYDVLARTGEVDPVFGGIPSITSFLNVSGPFPASLARFMIIPRGCFPTESTGPYYYFASDPLQPCSVSTYRGVVTARAVPEPNTSSLLLLGFVVVGVWIGVSDKSRRPYRLTDRAAH